MKSYADSYDSELAQQSIGGSSLPGSTRKFSLLSLYPGHQGGEDILLKEEQKVTEDLLDKFKTWYKDPNYRLMSQAWAGASEELLARHLNTLKNTKQRRAKRNTTFAKQLGDRLSTDALQHLIRMRDNGDEVDDATLSEIANEPNLVRELSLKSGDVQSTCRARIIFSAPQSAISKAARDFITIITTRDGDDKTRDQDTKDIIYEMRGRKVHDLFSIILGKPFSDWTTPINYTAIGDLWPAWEAPTSQAQSKNMDPVDPFLTARERLASSLGHTEELSGQAEAQLREHLGRLIGSAKSRSPENYSKDPVHYVWSDALRERDKTLLNTSKDSVQSSG